MAGPPTAFGPVHVIEPAGKHTHTAILLHGRGSTGEEFAEELAETLLSDHRSLMQSLPTWRWVFPSSREIWNDVFEEAMPSWFDAYSLTDITARQETQTEGIRESVKHVEEVVHSEIESLGGSSRRVVLGGISQGGAIGLWTLLRICIKKHEIRLGAFTAASTWLPFSADISRALSQKDDDLEAGLGGDFVRSMIGVPYQPQYRIPTFLGHGSDDAYVDMELGKQARDVLLLAGFEVQWKEYSGAEQEGHWLKAPEEIDDIAAFLRKIQEN